ncbi:MAG: hypothetical protein J0J01_09010 [Reyranella sp.]|uniref:hypothetical protein n=1 Tax=Reyranella sp. TaxID=1929291 RepID=UPI001ACB2834|nr:hypothetical protein [Reyranella sp.]MBN9087033.1 hypothetical protein [Reyranella sp.]
MSDDVFNSLPNLPTTGADREELLAHIWGAQAIALLAALQKKPSAALLNVARAFLADNGVDSTALQRGVGMTKRMGELFAKLPVFEDAEIGIERVAHAGESFAPAEDDESAHPSTP